MRIRCNVWCGYHPYGGNSYKYESYPQVYGSSPHQLYKMSLYHYWQNNKNKCNLEIVTFSIFKSMSLWWKFKFSLLFFPLMKHLSTYSLVIFPNTAVTVLIFYFRNKQ